MKISLSLLLALTATPMTLAQYGNDQAQFRPRFTSTTAYTSSGQCKLRVQIDDEGEVTMSGDTVWLRTLRGRPNYDVGSECTSPLPRRVTVTDFRKTDGPGRAELTTRSGRDNQVSFYVRDSSSGSHKYTLEFRWVAEGGAGDYRSGEDYRYRDYPYRDDPYDNRNNGRGNDRGRGRRNAAISDAEAMRMCEQAVRNAVATDYGYRVFDIDSINIDNRRGQSDWVTGTGSARAGFRPARLQFSCRVDFQTGQLLDVQVRR
jgi:hypothetical protein